MSFEIDYENLEEGDVIEVSPIAGSRVIGEIIARGGEVYLDGNSIIVVSLPKKSAPAPVEKAVEPTPEPELPNISPEPTLEKTFEEYVPNVVEEAIAASYEEDDKSDLLAEEEAVIEPAPESTPAEELAPPAVSEAPIKRARTKKVSSPSPVKE